MVIGGTLSIVFIVFALALMGFALWKKDWLRIIMSICLIILGTFAIEYDIKIAAPMVTVGAVLFIMAVLTRIRHAREETRSELLG